MTKGMYEVLSNKRIAQDTYEMELSGTLRPLKGPVSL